ncbi:hypothetical protein [Dactylosporangium sp. CA-139066]|uniref:hypothetical protein n=1 Tax=Dactylosporangium sp. CA-139066 TaxID=3239930 RepID=UPI003D8D765C
MDYSILLDPAARPGPLPRVELPAGMPVLAAAEALEALFEAAPGIQGVSVVVGAEELGATSRQHIMPDGHVRGLGDGDGASLPGFSGRYELLRYVCGVCDEVTYRLHVDPRDPPVCPRGHGPLEPAS